MSPLWTGVDLAAATGGTLHIPFDATGVSIDSRTIRPGELFIALVGERDGHAHVAAALARGAAGAMVHDPGWRRRADLPDGAPLLIVEDTLNGLTALGAAGRGRFAGPVVAVTGSVGKTTTKEMLRRCLSVHGRAHAAEGSHNNHWGVPLTLARLPRDAAACVVEIGMNHAGEIAPLSRLARPDVAVITALGMSHVGHLGSLEAIADEKAAIVAGLRHGTTPGSAPGGTVVLPADSRLLPRLRAAVAGQAILTFGADPAADARLTGIEAHADWSVVTATIAGRRLTFNLGAPGRHMALNALAALACVRAAGFDVGPAATTLAGFLPVAGRGAARPIQVGGGRALLIDESYNAAAASVRAALSVLALQPAARRIAVFGDMLELGDHAAAEHRNLADAVNDCADLLFTCGPHMRLLHDAVAPTRRGGHAADAASLAPLVAAALRAEDAVLVKGSNGSRMQLVVQAITTMPVSAPSASVAA